MQDAPGVDRARLVRRFFDDTRSKIRNSSQPGRVLPVLPIGTNVTVLALGKSAVEQGQSLREALVATGLRVETSLCVTKSETARPPGLDVIVGDHPMPGERSVVAGRELLRRAASATDALVVAISGGGSSLAFDPIDPVEVSDLRSLTEASRSAGLPIDRWNALRRALCRVKNGGLARASSANRIHGLITVDVPSRDPSVVASGPLSESPIDVAALLQTLDELCAIGRLEHAISERVGSAIRSAAASIGAEAGPRADLRIVASDVELRDAAISALRAAGVDDTTPLGPSDRAMSATADSGLEDFETALRAWLATRIDAAEPGALLTTGEFEVPLDRESLCANDGRGGRCSNFVVGLAARLLEPEAEPLPIPLRRLVTVAIASDGDDGNSDRAGGFLDLSRIDGDASLADLRSALAGSDTAGLLDRLQCSFEGGATGTNLMDLYAVLDLPSA